MILASTVVAMAALCMSADDVQSNIAWGKRAFTMHALVALVVTLVSVSANAVSAADPVAQETLMSRIRTIHMIDFEDITPGEGLLPKRARYTLDMYKAYTPQHVLTLN